MEQEEQTEQGQAQAVEGYGCSCGYKTEKKKEITKHVMLASKRDGKGTHKSIGRVDVQTGEVILPPYIERTLEQKARTKYKADSKSKEGVPVRITERWDQATEVRVVPRVFQMNFTPIMQLAKIASMRVFGWPDLAWEDLIDTIFDQYFKEHGVLLRGYIVLDEVEEVLEREKEELKEEVISS